MSSKFGLSPSEVHSIRAVLAAHPEVKRVLVYGSRAMGTQRKNSDIDLTLIAPNLTFDQLLKIENEPDDLLLPYKIDLSQLHTITNPALIDHIQRVRVEFNIIEPEQL